MSGQDASQASSVAHGVVGALTRIRHRIQMLLQTSQPALYVRHLRSVIALCEEEILRLQFEGTARGDQDTGLPGYLNIIESGLENDGGRAETYLSRGRRALVLARISRSDGTLQSYSVKLPQRWDPERAYPLIVELHGRGADLPVSFLSNTFVLDEEPSRKDEAITLRPWLRGNGTWREDNGSEPDLWEALDDLKSFAKLDPDRWYISGHSWGGDDVWAIVQRTPNLWAAAGIMSGHPGSAPPELGLVPNMRHVPFYVWIGDQDPIPNRKPAFAQFREALTAVGNRPTAVVAQGVAHNPRPQDSAALKGWLLEHVRHRPVHFSFVVDTPRHRGIWGISVPQKYPLAYGNVEPRVSFECWMDGSTVRIKTSNAAKLNVDLGPGGLNIPGTATLIVNGNTKFRGNSPAKPLSVEL